MINQVYSTRSSPHRSNSDGRNKAARRLHAKASENKPRTGLPLPDELVILVFEYLDEWDGNAFELSAPDVELLLVCRQFYRVGCEFVYKHFEHDWSLEGRSSFEFMRTLHQNPQLAQYVRTVQEHRNAQTNGPMVPSRRPFRYTVRDTITAIIDDLDLPDRDNLVAQFVKGTHIFKNLELAILICQTPRIEELFINSMPGHRFLKYLHRAEFPYPAKVPPVLEPILHAARGIPYGEVHQFAHLKHLYISLHSLRFNAISPIFRLPSLRRLDLQNVREIHPTPNDSTNSLTWECDPGESPITELAFAGSILPSAPVVQAILSCKALKQFIYTILTNMEQQWYPNVVEALQEHSESLEIVAIVIPDFDHPDLVGIGPEHTFRDFARLKVLQVPLIAMTASCGFFEEAEETEADEEEEMEDGQEDEEEAVEMEEGGDVEEENEDYFQEDEQISDVEDAEAEAEYIPEFGYPHSLTNLTLYTMSVDPPAFIQDYIITLASRREDILPNLSNMAINIYPLADGDEEGTWENRLDEDYLTLMCVTNSVWLEINVDWETANFCRVLTFGLID